MTGQTEAVRADLITALVAALEAAEEEAQLRARLAVTKDTVDWMEQNDQLRGVARHAAVLRVAALAKARGEVRP